jgi:hypothetical protein
MNCERIFITVRRAESEEKREKTEKSPHVAREMQKDLRLASEGKREPVGDAVTHRWRVDEA